MIKLKVIPPLIFRISVCGLKSSISTFPSSKLSPFFIHTPLFVLLLNKLKCHSFWYLNNPRNSMFGLIGIGAGGGGAGRTMGAVWGLLGPPRSNGLTAFPIRIEKEEKKKKRAQFINLEKIGFIRLYILRTFLGIFPRRI